MKLWTNLQTEYKRESKEFKSDNFYYCEVAGLDVAYTLRQAAITEKRQSWKNAHENGFTVGSYEELIPHADLIVNLTPDKQHSAVVEAVMPLMKQGAALGYSHGFNIVEVGQKIRADITVVMVAPKCPGTEVREEYKRGFGVPTLIAVHPETKSRMTDIHETGARIRFPSDLFLNCVYIIRY